MNKNAILNTEIDNIYIYQMFKVKHFIIPWKILTHLENISKKL